MRLHEPLLHGQEVVFRWEVTPPTELYLRTNFRLSFPDAVDVASVPRALWWRILLICMHAHFAVLRPCVVELPVGLGAAERDFWQRLVANVATHLEAYGDPHRPGPVVEIRDCGPELAPVRLSGAADRVVAAFSGGKDSLVQAALAAEITERPLLVTITSPVPWARDHIGDARTRAHVEVPQMLPVEVVEVRSDFRTSWELGFSVRNGCAIGVHELSDVPLYYGALAAVAAANGIGQKLLASEADAQYNSIVDGRTVVQPDAMSSLVAQHAFDVLLRRFGQGQGSLTYPMHAAQVQALLLQRYRGLAKLQFSCWKAPEGERSCSTCAKCFGITLVTLAEGVSPRAIGIDAVKALLAYADWEVGTPPDGGAFVTISGLWIDRVIRALQRGSTHEVTRILADESDCRRGQALAIYARLRAEALRKDIPPEPGYVTDFLDLVPADMRRPLEAILAQHFPPTNEPEFRAMSKRARALAAWIGEPLEAERGGGWRRPR